MLSPFSKKIAFYYNEENLTVVALEKNIPLQVMRVPVFSKTDGGAPFSFPVKPEDRITELFGEVLKTHQIQGQNVCISLPTKDSILRSFTIPFVTSGELAKIIKFEARKYLPLDIEHLTLVYHAEAYMEQQRRRLRVTFFALRNELLASLKRTIQQLKVNVLVCEPAYVSVIRLLLSKREIKPEGKVAFLYLDKNSGYICFISKGIPVFVRDFPINVPKTEEVLHDHAASFNRFVLNEVINSLGFYTRQFSSEPIGKIIVTSWIEDQDLLNTMATELKMEVKKFSPGILGQDLINSMDAMYALGAGLKASPDRSLDDFNFFDNKTQPSTAVLKVYKDVWPTLIICVCLLAGVWGYFQLGLKNIQKTYAVLKLQHGGFVDVTVDNLQEEIAKNAQALATYKDIKTQSDVSSILLRVAVLIPKGIWLKHASVYYEGTLLKDLHARMEINGDIFKDDPNEQIVAVNELVFAFKNDKVLSRLFSHVTMGPLTREQANSRDVTAFSIHFS